MRRVGSWALSLIVHILLFGFPSPERPPVVPGKAPEKIPILLLAAEGPAASPTPPAAGKADEAVLSPPAAKPAPAQKRQAPPRPAVPPEPERAAAPLTVEPEEPRPERLLPPEEEDFETIPSPPVEGEAPEREEVLSSDPPASEKEEPFSIEGAEESEGRSERPSSTGGQPEIGMAGESASTFQGGAAWESYLAALRERIEAARAYPERARRMGQEGRVTVRLVVGADGKILEVEIAEASSSLLNRAAVQTIRSLSPLPPLPPELEGRLEVTVPIVYHLDRSARR